MPPAVTPLLAPDISRLPAPPVSVPPTWRGVALVDVEADCTPESPLVVGFELRDILGEGGMGTVYRALQEYPHRVVALKVLKTRTANGDAFRRFKREVEVLARLQHQGIPPLYSAGTLESPGGPVPYIAMECVQGKFLDAYCQAKSVDHRERVELFLKVCDAVAAVHRGGILHRDLSPRNILVTDSGQPKVLDFGLACFTQDNAHLQTMLTTPGRPFGTLSYASPEQACGRTQEIDERSDVYSLGAILYSLLAGVLPIDVENVELPEAVERIQTVIPVPLGQRQRTLRGDLEIVVSKALSKAKDARYASVREFAEDLQRFQSHEPIRARRRSLVYRGTRFFRRHVRAVAVTASIAGVIGVGSLATWRESIQAQAARQEATIQQANGSLAQANASLAKGDFVAARNSYSRAWDLLDQMSRDSLPARLGLWQAADQSAPIIRDVDSDSKDVERVSIAANDSCLALLKTDGRLTVRDVVTNGELTHFHTTQNVHDMQFSPDGRHLVVLGDQATESWNSSTGVLEAQWPHPAGFVPLLRVSNNSVFVAGNQAIVRDSFEGSAPSMQWTIPGEGLRAIGTNAQDQLFVVDREWNLRRCGPSGNAEILGEVSHADGNSQVQFRPDGNAFVVVAAQEASVYAIAGLNRLSTLTGIKGHANGGFAGGQALVFAREAKESKVLFDIAGEPQMEVSALPSSTAAFSDDLAVVAAEHGAVQLLLTRPHPGMRLLGQEHAATAAALDPQGSWAAYGTSDDHVQLCDAGNGAVVRELDCSGPLLGTPIRWICFGANGTELVVASTRQVAFLDRRSGTLQASFTLAAPISGFSFSRAAETAAAVEKNSKTLLLWNRAGESWTLTETPIVHEQREADVTADGSQVLLSGGTSGVELWQTRPAIALVRDFPELDTPKALFDATAHAILSLGESGQILVTPTDPGGPTSLLTQANSIITGITPFGQHGVVFASGGALSFYDLRDHRPVYSLPLPNQSAQFISASDDGDRLLVYGRKPGPAMLLDFGFVRELRRVPKTASDEMEWFSRLGIHAHALTTDNQKGGSGK